MDRLRAWFAENGWTPFSFQEETWAAYARGESGLLHAPTGAGKTYAVWLGPLGEWLSENPGATVPPITDKKRYDPPPIQVLWITPLRALAKDTAFSLASSLLDCDIPWTVDLRTGDTSAAARKRQRTRLPTALITTPESLSLLLSYDDARAKFASLRCVIVDEWHELMGTKRGVQTELALARLRHFQPKLRTWGLSATLGNISQAAEVLLGGEAERGRIVSGDLRKPVAVETLIPPDLERFPWAGHLGLRLLPQVLRAIHEARSTLLFTNTRSQAERWFQAIAQIRPPWVDALALHHGSIDRGLREAAEDKLRTGELKCVVCTSSLDLGVDFSPVDQVIQVGSPKGVARLLQRAGRSGHQPGALSRVVCVPTNALELVEFAAARTAVEARAIESRVPLDRPLDVLVQHMVTVAVGEGFDSAQLYDEVRQTHAFRDLSAEEWAWCLDFVTRGGPALKAYPEYSRLVELDGRYVPASTSIARRHRMSIGTITSDGSMLVKFMKGGTLGSIEESFIARLRPGDKFLFAGRILELFSVRDMVAYVRKARGAAGRIPRWMGGRLPLSSELSAAVLEKFAEAANGEFLTPELQAARPLMLVQARWSLLPDPTELLIEHTASREGWHAYLYPFAGRLVHEGLASLLAYRLTREAPRTVTVSANDYGLELLSAAPLELNEAEWTRLLQPEGLVEDLLACLNSTELARRQFREIARVSGLIFPGFPGSGKNARQMQVSSGLLFDVFVEYDKQNLLIEQARREVLERQLEVRRLSETLRGLGERRLHIVATSRLTPLAFPIWAERIEAQVSTEKWTDRVRRMAVQLEAVAEGETSGKRSRPVDRNSVELAPLPTVAAKSTRAARPRRPRDR